MGIIKTTVLFIIPGLGYLTYLAFKLG